MNDTADDDRSPEPVDPLTSSKQARRALGVSIAISVLLWVIPFGDTIGYPLLLISTVAHELGHGLTALVLGGRFDQLVIDRYAGGFANVEVSSGFRFALVAAGGLIGPAVVAALSFRAAHTRNGARAIAVVYAAVILWVVLFIGTSDPTANGFLDRYFGLGFLAVLAGTLLFLALRAGAAACQFGVVLIAVQLALSVFSRSDYLFTKNFRGPNGQTLVSDTQRMAESLWLPYWVWGAVCGLLSIFILIQGVRPYLRGPEGESKEEST
ncbi:MAG: M50 family metallopeptidase [Planctomycetota bacterium]